MLNHAPLKKNGPLGRGGIGSSRGDAWVTAGIGIGEQNEHGDRRTLDPAQNMFMTL